MLRERKGKKGKNSKVKSAYRNPQVKLRYHKLDICLREKVENGKIKNKRVGRMILRKRMGVISNER